MHIGKLIDTYLREHHMSQREFARRCDLSNGYISMLINNINPRTGKPLVPSLSALLAISHGMGMSLDELIKKADDINVDISAAKNLSLVTENKSINEFTDLFNKLTPEQQTLIISQIKGILSNQ